MLARGLGSQGGLGWPLGSGRSFRVTLRKVAGPGLPATYVDESKGCSDSRADRHTEKPPNETKARICASRR